MHQLTLQQVFSLMVGFDIHLTSIVFHVTENALMILSNLTMCRFPYDDEDNDDYGVDHVGHEDDDDDEELLTENVRIELLGKRWFWP